MGIKSSEGAHGEFWQGLMGPFVAPIILADKYLKTTLQPSSHAAGPARTYMEDPMDWAGLVIYSQGYKIHRCLGPLILSSPVFLH